MPKEAMVRPTKVYGERQHPATMTMDSQVEKDRKTPDYVYETEKEDNDKDVFSDFVNRAKIKIRKTSSFGSRRNISFKE
ncbi:hypothetical protein M0R45_028104 [Rubus argutus]|uniref:Uncharacterized protein n=1 Tax=Rubus argutus TaxID=59490 RepID=A0AAW1W6S6_RUBAR